MPHNSQRRRSFRFPPDVPRLLLSLLFAATRHDITHASQGRDCHILLQNENGPCPLIAAANALLLRGNISLPAHSIRNSVASLEDLTNTLANHAMMHQEHADVSGDDEAHRHAISHQFIDELLVHIPKFQYGMDVNPKFTQGVTGYEYTSQLGAFDLLRVKLVHGWLVDPQEREVYETIGSDSYNSLVEKVIHGNEATSELEKAHGELAELRSAAETAADACAAATAAGPPADLLDDQPIANSEKQQQQQQQRASEVTRKIAELERRCDELHDAATRGSLINNFLNTTGHQLTIFGLQVLYEELNNDELCVFFRNNHFATITKHEGILYLLVTDLGYANVPNIVWEKLDVIDGDTEYVNSQFLRNGEQGSGGDGGIVTSGPTLTPEQLMAQSGQKESDYQLALHLSRQTDAAAAAASASAGNPNALDAQEGQLVAAATEASLRSYHGLSDGIKTVDAANGGNDGNGNGGSSSKKKEIVSVGVPLGAIPTANNNNTNNDITTATHGGTIVQLPPVAGGSGAGAGAAGQAAGRSASSSPGGISSEDADKLLAMQLQAENESHDEASLRLARQLQEEENQRAAVAAAATRQQQQQQRQTAGAATRRPQAAAATTAGDGSSAKGCVIS